MSEKQKLALVIGSGSIKSVAALGLLKVFQEEGIDIDMVVGCSGGSLMGALVSMGLDAATAMDMVLGIWTKDIMTKVSLRSVLQLLFPRRLGFNADFALMDDTPVMRDLRRAYGPVTFEEMKIPLFLVATDVTNGKRVVLSEGDVVTAIRASMGIPLIFGPVQHNDMWLGDGGASDPLPIGVAIKEGADIIVAMGFESPYHSETTSLMNVITQSSSIAINNLTKSTFSFYSVAHHAEIVPIMMRFDQHIDLFDTHLFPYIMEEGEKEARKQLDYIHKLLEHSDG